MVTEIIIDDSVFVLANIYNANTEPELRHTLNDLINIHETFEDIKKKIVVLGGDFNVILDFSLDLDCATPVIKRKKISKLMQIKENLDLCDIWRIRSYKRKRFTFRQQRSTGFVQKRLDYFFISNTLQESIKTTNTLAAPVTDRSLITPFFCHLKQFPLRALEI